MADEEFVASACNTIIAHILLQERSFWRKCVIVMDREPNCRPNNAVTIDFLLSLFGLFSCVFIHFCRTFSYITKMRFHHQLMRFHKTALSLRCRMCGLYWLSESFKKTAKIIFFLPAYETFTIYLLSKITLIITAKSMFVLRHVRHLSTCAQNIQVYIHNVLMQSLHAFLSRPLFTF